MPDNTGARPAIYAKKPIRRPAKVVKRAKIKQRASVARLALRPIIKPD